MSVHRHLKSRDLVPMARSRASMRSAPALLIRGRLERAEGVINVVAERIEALDLAMGTRSRDFR